MRNSFNSKLISIFPNVIITGQKCGSNVEREDIRSTKFEWDRSFSEPDLTDPLKGLNRFHIKNPHEYISVDDLKFFRRKKPPDLHTKSNICLYSSDEPVLPFSSLKSEYTKNFHALNLGLRPKLLRRSTSLRLEGIMNNISEHQEQYHWYTPADWEISRTYPIRNPECFRLGSDLSMDAEYRSSYISHPMVDRTMKILPREMFRIDPEPMAASVERGPAEVASLNKLAEDKFRRDVAAQEHQKCHLQQRAAETHCNATPSEYKQQFVQFPIEKAHSIPQISHMKMQGDFIGIPEYQDSYRMYANYSKSAPIKKVDNLRVSGAEVMQTSPAQVAKVPEYKEQFRDPPKEMPKEKSLKTDDHLHPRGEFTKDLPEYHESFRDPQVKELPERGKCREPYLRLKGKLEFNPEYRNTYLDFPRSRPIVQKPVSSLRLPISSTSSTNPDQRNSPRHKYKSSSPNRVVYATEPPTDITITPEYRRAQYNFQLRERSPTKPEVACKFVTNTAATRKSSDSSLEPVQKSLSTVNKRRSIRNRQASIADPNTAGPTQSNFENISTTKKKPARFGRRASVLQNAANCRGNSSIIEGNPKYSQPEYRTKYKQDERGSFVVLDEPCKRTNWMKKSWYES